MDRQASSIMLEYMRSINKESLERKLVEVPVEFKWFVDGLVNETIFFAGEESFIDEAHLAQIQNEAKVMVSKLF